MLLLGTFVRSENQCIHSKVVWARVKEKHQHNAIYFGVTRLWFPVSNYYDLS